MSVLDELKQQLGAEEVQQISQQVGADPVATQAAIQAALPMMLGGVASAAQQPGGAGAVQEAMQTHRGFLGGLSDVLGGIPADGGGLLGRILGRHQGMVQTGVQQASGLDPDQTKRLLLALAPIVMAMLAKRHANDKENELAPALQQEAQAAHEQASRTSPHVGGLLGKILQLVQTPPA
jgi:hypothetical protein